MERDPQEATSLFWLLDASSLNVCFVSSLAVVFFFFFVGLFVCMLLSLFARLVCFCLFDVLFAL